MTDDDLWERGHKRPWWYFNVLTLFAALFVLVWLRFLFGLEQRATILLTLLVVLGWMLLGATRRRGWAVTSLTLLATLFVLVWFRFLFGLHQEMIILLMLLVVFGWMVLGAARRPGWAVTSGLRPEGLLSAAGQAGGPPEVPPPPSWQVPLDVRNLHDVPAFTTKDGSEIRELLAYRNSCVRRQSLAEARLPPGASTTPHYHPRTEEIYYILSGVGTMRLERSVQQVGPGDAVAIPPGARHQITNTGKELLTFLCCCVPAYEHDDTILVEDWAR